MSTYEFTASDLEQIREHGLTLEAVRAQLERFGTGFPYLRLEGPATPGHGIRQLSEAEEAQGLARWQQYLEDGGKVLKFVPASGAASRMFKDLFAFVNSDEKIPADGSAVAKLLEGVHRLPFFDELDNVCRKLYGEGVDALLAQERHKDVVAAIIRPEGMNYGQLPKAVLTFHRYADDHTTRTAMEEQFAEGAQTAATNGEVHLHFTVSADHRKLFEDKIAQVRPAMEAKYGVRFVVSMSEQKPSTDTVAGATDGTPFRDEAGRLVFRPGGHGALIENLNDLDATVIFIKNIDNVVADSHREPTIRYKKLIGGLLLAVNDRREYFERALRVENAAEKDIAEAGIFVSQVLNVTVDCNVEPQRPLREILLEILRRPLRVCGMVRNEGEPGGGPYMAYSHDGRTCQPQILESTQIDTSGDEGKRMMASATHFNPVDLVCYVRNSDGDKYDLTKYTDPLTGFISSKSSGGRELRALELPGLWNGAMSNWNTVFVEVPVETFNPVKTVNDLLRPAHQ